MTLPIPDNTLLWLLAGAAMSGYVHLLLVVLLLLLAQFARTVLPSLRKPIPPSQPATHSLLLLNLTVPQAPPATASVAGPNADITPLSGLVTAATWIGGKPQNEDRFCFDDLGTAKLIIIADGVSSSSHGAVAAETVVQHVRQAIRAALAEANPRFDQAFFDAACKEAAQHIAGQIPQATSAESTVVILLELPDRVVLAYLGDGGAVWARGNQRGGRSLLLAQHDEYGRLSGFVGAQGVAGRPTVLQIQKSAETDGAIFVVGSDGALPRGQEIGRVHQLLQMLIRQAKTGAMSLTETNVAQVIESCLAGWQPDDNATLGLLFTQEALAYWQQHLASSREPKQGENDDNANPEHALALAQR